MELFLNLSFKTSEKKYITNDEMKKSILNQFKNNSQAIELNKRSSTNVD